jgi:predicted dinucleotide-binding enzyme
MKIAVIGAGHVGAALARHWKTLGHDVTFGVPDPGNDKARAAAAETGVPARKPAEAAAEADVVLLAVPGHLAVEAARGLGDLQGKILVDATNPIKAGFAGLDHPAGLSGAEQVAAAAPRARVVKAFNTIGFETMAQPRREGRSSMLLLSGEAQAVETIAALARAMGFEPLVLGGLECARMQEEHALLWIYLAFKAGHGRDWAFSVVRGS